jgi:hypothetical protein
VVNGAFTTLTSWIILIFALATIREAPATGRQFLLIVFLSIIAAVGLLAGAAVGTGPVWKPEIGRHVIEVLVFLSSVLLTAWLISNYLMPAALLAFGAQQSWERILSTQGQYIPLFITVQACAFMVAFLKEELSSIKFMISQVGDSTRRRVTLHRRLTLLLLLKLGEMLPLVLTRRCYLECWQRWQVLPQLLPAGQEREPLEQFSRSSAPS